MDIAGGQRSRAYDSPRGEGCKAERRGFNAGVTVTEIDLSFLSDFLGDAHVGKATYAYVVDPNGKVLATSSKGPDIARDLSALPQVAALMARGGKPHGSDFN
jgi:hypothetical protein